MQLKFAGKSPKLQGSASELESVLADAGGASTQQQTNYQTLLCAPFVSFVVGASTWRDL